MAKTELVKMSETIKGSIDGVTVKEYVKDQEYDLPSELVHQFRLANAIAKNKTGVDLYIEKLANAKPVNADAQSDEALPSEKQKTKVDLYIEKLSETNKTGDLTEENSSDDKTDAEEITSPENENNDVVETASVTPPKRGRKVKKG